MVDVVSRVGEEDGRCGGGRLIEGRCAPVTGAVQCVALVT